MDEAKLNTLKLDYDKHAARAKRFAFRLHEQLTELLQGAHITLAVPVECRVKNWESIADKIERKQLDLVSVCDLNDLVGLRVILLFKRDVDHTCKVLSSNFDVDASEDTTARLGVSQFGYQSIHYQVRFPHSWLAVPTFADFGGLTAEVQVRTAAQHIWAAASHVLQYKHEDAVPHEVLRSINRVSALLETVDLEFERALRERENYVREVDPRNREQSLNVDNLRIVMDRELPKENGRGEVEDYASLLNELKSIGVLQIGQLEDLLRKYSKECIDEDRRIVSFIRSRMTDEHGAKFDLEFKKNHFYRCDRRRIERGVFWARTGMLRWIISRTKVGAQGAESAQQPADGAQSAPPAEP